VWVLIYSPGAMDTGEVKCDRFPNEVRWEDVRFLSFVNNTAVAFQEERRTVYVFESAEALERALDELRERKDAGGGGLA